MQLVTANQTGMSLFLSLALSLLCRRTHGVLEKIHVNWPRLLTSCGISPGRITTVRLCSCLAPLSQWPESTSWAPIAPYKHKEMGKFDPVSMWRRCGVASCSRLCSKSTLNEEQNLDAGSPAFDYQMTLLWAGNRSQDALLWPTDRLGWPSSIWALTLYLFWQKGRLVKADTCLCSVSGASNLCVLSHYSVLQMMKCFLGFDIAVLHMTKAALEKGLLRYGML